MLRMAIMVGLIGAGAAIFAVPYLDSATNQLARTDDPGIDRILTGSVSRPGKERYTIRKSVLSPDAETICENARSTRCTQALRLR